MKISRVVLGIIIVCLTILGSGVMQAEGTAKIQVPMHEWVTDLIPPLKTSLSYNVI